MLTFDPERESNRTLQRLIPRVQYDDMIIEPLDFLVFG